MLDPQDGELPFVSRRPDHAEQVLDLDGGQAGHGLVEQDQATAWRPSAMAISSRRRSERVRCAALMSRLPDNSTSSRASKVRCLALWRGACPRRRRPS